MQRIGSKSLNNLCFRFVTIFKHSNTTTQEMTSWDSDHQMYIKRVEFQTHILVYTFDIDSIIHQDVDCKIHNTRTTVHPENHK
mmetsp:Transcript_12705/g.30043  ORF Transcript_12705/g.30043 Transcript_12705/m.30043 type:complete len:83 (-) Transcript_12705:201-449(-)